MATTANRGKWAEARVHDYLKTLSIRRANFDYERLPDARAAMGKFKSMIGDFEFFMPGVHGVIEAKETKHSYRITKDKLAQLPRLHKREMCGGLCVIVVYHTSPQKWRAFRAGQIGTGCPSWDLSTFKAFDTLSEALAQFEELK